MQEDKVICSLYVVGRQVMASLKGFQIFGILFTWVGVPSAKPKIYTVSRYAALKGIVWVDCEHKRADCL